MIVTFSEHLAELMTQEGLTKAELARRSGVSHVAIANYLNGRTPRWPEAEKLAGALGVQPDFLLNPGKYSKPLKLGSSVAQKVAALVNADADQQQIIFEMIEKALREDSKEQGSGKWRDRALAAERELAELKAKLSGLIK